MGLTHDVVKSVGQAMQDVHAGWDKLVSHRLVGNVAPRLFVTSPDFVDQSPLPYSATLEGGNRPPSLKWTGLPPQTKSIVVICEDPDAPIPEPFVHWMVYGISASETGLDEKSSLIWKQGKNSKLSTGFTGAAPPPGHGLHHYHFQVFALDTMPNLEDGEGRSALVDALQGHVLGWGEIVGTYIRT